MSEMLPAGVVRGLRQQGYTGCTNGELRQLAWGLRFTPAVCMAAALVGLAARYPPIHYALAVLGGLALVLPAHHPLDMLYNHLVRPWTGGPLLPPNPWPRRVACFLGGAMNLGIGLAFQAGVVWLAYLIGSALIVLQLIVISSHFCVASWLMEIAGLLRGQPSERVDGNTARRVLAAGGMLVDVRTPAEFAAGHLPEAVNVPLQELPGRAQELLATERPLVVHCAGGVRSRQALDILRAAGGTQIYDLGSIDRW